MAVAATVVVVTFPSVAATTCPSCYGMEQLGPDLYIEPGLSPAQQAQVSEVVDAARRRVGDFYGGRESTPSILACITDVCYRRIGGGGERGVGVLNRAVMLSPRGVAVVVSEDPRYLAPQAASDRHPVSSEDDLPVTLADWVHAASADEQLYAKAACRVSRWMSANGGPRAVRTLVDRFRAGEGFATIVKG
ncbi:MAG: hypothetical protein M3Z25_07710 [Actinomycetota bacterium]|nr:hypothetical protein [Actinomycetota bacterium]